MTKRCLALVYLMLSIGGASAAVAAPKITVAPASFDFGSVRVANAAVTTATQQFTISNTGDVGSTLRVSSITLSSADYAITPAVTFPLVIARGASAGITVELDPSAPGPRPAMMVVASDDPSSRPRPSR
jgi:hypothetical protein